MRGIIAVLALCMALSGLLGAKPTAKQGPRELYVAQNGSDRQNGSKSHPFATITFAAQQVHPGDTVHAAPGVYHESVTSSISGTADKPIRFVSDTKWAAKVISSSGNPWCNNGSYVTIEGFDITGAGSNGIANNCNGGGASYVKIVANYVHDMNSDNCKTDGGGSGITVDIGYYNSHDVTVDSNLVKNIGTGSPYGSTMCSSIHGIYMATANNYAWNNIVYNVSGWGIHQWHYSNRNQILNNTVVLAKDGGILVGSSSTTIDNCKVNNNILYKNRVGIGEQASGKGSIGSNNEYRNNLFYGNRRDLSLLRNRASSSQFADPQFAAPFNGDLHLKPGSPAIGKALPAGLSHDFDGMPRSNQPAPSIGALEFKSQS